MHNNHNSQIPAPDRDLYPILFSTKLVQSILDGEKTQTRRIIKPRSSCFLPLSIEPWMVERETQETDDKGRPLWIGKHRDYPTGSKWFSCPYGKIGDFLWVKEKAKVIDFLTLVDNPSDPLQRFIHLQYEADGSKACIQYPERLKWIPKKGSYFPRGNLFREASRITLEVTSIRVERLQDISTKDAIAEGIPRSTLDPIADFKSLWDGINSSFNP